MGPQLLIKRERGRPLDGKIQSESKINFLSLRHVCIGMSDYPYIFHGSQLATLPYTSVATGELEQLHPILDCTEKYNRELTL